MRAFIVDLENQPGALAGLAETIAGRGVNITGLAGVGSGDSGMVGLITNDDSGTRSALEGGSYTFQETDVVTAKLDHRPGTLADATRRMATAGINLSMAALIGTEGDRILVAFGVDNAQNARTALAELAGD
jgi:hypothetical protein